MNKETLYKSYKNVFNNLDKWLSPLWFLYVRYWLAEVFLRSGLVSVSDWGRNLLLYKYEFKVPLISPELAAYLSTAVELICPVLLLIGLGTRFAAIAILFTSLVIEFTYMHNFNHIIWILASSLLILKGADKISLDYLISKRAFRDLNEKRK